VLDREADGRATIEKSGYPVRVLVTATEVMARARQTSAT
jgi:orotate phosphoribosyltransferase